MSTRCATIVKQQSIYYDGTREDELFRFYRHCDGYPSGHGLDMAEAFIAAEEKGTADKDRWFSQGLNNRNWVQKCFAELFAADCDLEVEPPLTQHWDIEFLYVVEGMYGASGGKHNIDSLPVTIAVYDAYVEGESMWSDDSKWSYDLVMQQEPLFKGNPHEFKAWVEAEGKGF